MATNARYLYESRIGQNFKVNIDAPRSLLLYGEVVWSAAMLSNAVMFGNADYDSVASVSHPNVASLVKAALPDSRDPICRGLPTMLRDLSRHTTDSEIEPVIVVYAREYTLAKLLGAKPSPMIQEAPGFADTVWRIYNTLTQLKLAGLQDWSVELNMTMEDELNNIFYSWKQLNLITKLNMQYTIGWKYANVKVSRRTPWTGFSEAEMHEI